MTYIIDLIDCPNRTLESLCIDFGEKREAVVEIYGRKYGWQWVLETGEQYAEEPPRRCSIWWRTA